MCMRVVIIGNGIAGNTACSTIRSFNRDVEITLISEEEKPLYSPCVFPHFISGELEKERVFLKELEDYSKEDIDLILKQEVAKIDPENKKVFLDKTGIEYDKLIIATGSKTAVPPIVGLNKNGILTLKSVEDAEIIYSYKGRRIVIIGAGPIGLETAISLQKRGYEVYVIELLDRVLPRLFDEKPASIVKRILERHDIKVFTGEKVNEIIGEREVKGVITNKCELECDVVLLATGMKPRTELAKGAGIELGEFEGIKVDSRMRTNVEDVYACGDCVEIEDVATGKSKLSLLWHTAKLQGYIAGCNCLGIRKRYPGSLNFAVICIYGTYAVSSGNTATEFKERNPEIVEKDMDGDYLRLIIANGTIAGMQFVGKEIKRELGILLGVIKKRENAKDLKKIFETEEFICYFPWLRSIYPYLRDSF